jgi:P-type Na+/K+ transporter
MYGGNLGDSCNRRWSAECEGVYKARSVCFMIMVIASLLLAASVMTMRRSFFRQRRKEDRHHTVTQPFRDLWQNKCLAVTIVVGFAASVMSLYIPLVNERLFKHAPIGKEWGVALVLILIWFLSVEGYKWLVRRYFRAKELEKGERGDLEARAFRTWMTGEKDGGVEVREVAEKA